VQLSTLSANLKRNASGRNMRGQKPNGCDLKANGIAKGMFMGVETGKTGKGYVMWMWTEVEQTM